MVMMRPPSALSKKIAVFRQVEMPQPLKNAMEAGMMQPGTLRYKAGKIHVLVSPPFKAYGWHMSISCHNRYPTWDEVVAAWYTLVPGAQNREGAMILPPLKDYINIAEYCFQVHEVIKP